MRPTRSTSMLPSSAGAALLLAAFASGCGSSDAVPVVVSEGPGDDVGYVDGTDVVVVDDVTYVVTGPLGEACIQIGDQCVDLAAEKAKHCGDADAQADVVVVDGQVVDIICYPPKESGTSIQEVERTADGTAEVPQNANNTVVTFDDATNGVPVKGDLNLAAENIAIIGNGVDQTIIDGNIKLDSNNARIRGLTVTGNVTLEKNSNGASISFCRIEGNLEIHANNVSVVACQVFGNLDIKGNGAVVVNVGVGGNFNVVATEICDGNYAFADDGDFLVAPTEVGADLTCSAQ